MDAPSADGFEPIENASIEPNNNETKTHEPRGVNRIENVNALPSKFEKQHSLQDFFAGKKNIGNTVPSFQRGRSNSDGALIENAEAFPSLPNTVLEKLGLYGDVARERLNDESLEQKFTSLSLAFTIDATTIKDRCERQRRTRDRTESNFNLEVEKLTERLAMLKPLCTDFETADLLSTLFSQVETLTRAASLVSIAAERFGAVQHEERLTESVQLMVSYVQALKQQRDSARRQLQYTKRVLQEPVQPSVLHTPSLKTFSGVNKKLISKRRASTDSVNLNSHQPDQSFKLNRRISDLSFRASLTKSRPSRLDLGMELNKIKENSMDEGGKDEPSKLLQIPVIELTKEDFDSDVELNGHVTTDSNQLLRSDDSVISEISNFIRFKFNSYIADIQRRITEIFKKWSENGYLHVFLNSCAILCFSISILTLVSIFLEQDYAKSPIHWLLSWLNKNY